MALMTWSNWLYELAAATIQGAAAGVLFVLVDPTDFNLHEWRHVAAVAATSAVFALCNALRKSPLPPKEAL